MTSETAPLELRMRRSWRTFITIAVPAFFLLIVGGSVAILSSGRGPAGGIIGVAMLVAILGGLIVVPGTALLIRLARGVPDVRLDDQGIVWGADRSRDLAINWTAIEGVTSRRQKTQYLTDRLFVVRPRSDAAVTRPQTAYGRFMAIGNRMSGGSRFVISTMTADQSWDRIRTTIEAHLERPIEDGEGTP